jgi:hypothetical protein
LVSPTDICYIEFEDIPLCSALISSLKRCDKTRTHSEENDHKWSTTNPGHKKNGFQKLEDLEYVQNQKV